VPAVPQAPKILQVSLLAATQVVSHRNPDLIMIAAQDVVADAIAGGHKCDIAVINTDDRTALQPIGTRTAINGVRIGGKAHNPAKLGQIGLEQPRQNDTARILPLLKRRWSLREGRPAVTSY